MAARFPPGPPLVRGSIGHVGLAHLYARQRATQRGEDPERYYKPLAAMDLTAGTFGDLGAEMLPIASRAVRAYVQQHYNERWEILNVEEQEETSFSGHRYTARIDVEWRDRAGKVWFTDHKFVGRIESKVLRRYVLSGQFLGATWLGVRKHGANFGGVQLNLIGCNTIGFLRHVPEPAPWMLERFPGVVQLAEEGIAEVERRIREGLTIPASPSEHTCYGSYGECPAFELCRWGPRFLGARGALTESEE